MGHQDFGNLKEKLESMYSWPSLYLFKFIIKDDPQKLAEITALFNPEKDTIEIKSSSKGTYQSISIESEMKSADDVISIYETAARIEGVIAL